MNTTKPKTLCIISSIGGITFKVIECAGNTLKIDRYDNSLIPTRVNANSNKLQEVISYFEGLSSTKKIVLTNS